MLTRLHSQQVRYRLVKKIEIFPTKIDNDKLANDKLS